LTQKDILKFYLIWAYDSAKNNESLFNNNPFGSHILPRIETSNGIKLNTLKKLSNWLNSLYQDNKVDIISCNSFISISQSKKEISRISADDFETLNGEKSGITNFKEKLSLEKWVENTIDVNLIRWIKDFHLLQGLIIESYKIKSSDKIAIDFIGIPKLNLSKRSYFEIINPTAKLEEDLISNNIFSIKNIKTFPFIRIDNFSDKDYNYIYLIVKCEQYEILISKDCIKASEELNNAIEKALNNMKPFNALQEVFNEYGQLLSLRIILEKSLKNILTTTFFGTFEQINLKLPIFESLQLYLNRLNISYLLTQKGEIIGKNDILNWIQNTNDLEIIEYDEVISLYDILELEQKRKIDIVLNNYNQDNFKIIITGITDLKDLDDNNTEYYKHINIEPSLENENYEVFGSIVTRNNVKIEDFFIKFGFYDVNGFSAMIKTLKESIFNIKDCFILWMIIGNPVKLSVFSPNNREIQVDHISESIILQPGQSIYSIKTPFPLSQGYNILINAYYPSSNYEAESIRLIEWSYNCIDFQIIEPTYNESTLTSSNSDIVSDSDSEVQQVQHKVDDDNSSTNSKTAIINMDLHICILQSDYRILKIDNIDNKEKECYLDSFGYVLTKENLNQKSFHETDIQNIKQPDDIQPDYSIDKFVDF